LETYYEGLIKNSRGKYAPVSLRTPLLSNLDIVENIALIEEVHQKVSRINAHTNAINKLKKINSQHLANNRTSQCNEYEHFIAGLIRASMMQYATIIIVTPLMQYSSIDPIGDMQRVIHALEITVPIIILDLKLYEKEYEAKGLICHTIV